MRHSVLGAYTYRYIPAGVDHRVSAPRNTPSIRSRTNSHLDTQKTRSSSKGRDREQIFSNKGGRGKPFFSLSLLYFTPAGTAENGLIFVLFFLLRLSLRKALRHGQGIPDIRPLNVRSTSDVWHGPGVGPTTVSMGYAQTDRYSTFVPCTKSLPVPRPSLLLQPIPNSIYCQAHTSKRGLESSLGPPPVGLTPPFPPLPLPASAPSPALLPCPSRPCTPPSYSSRLAGYNFPSFFAPLIGSHRPPLPPHDPSL